MSSLYDKKMKNRLKRAEGQIRGVLNMMEDEKDCKEVVTQLSAIRSSIDRTIGLIVGENLTQCVLNPQEGDNEQDSIQKAIDLIVKSR